MVLFTKIWLHMDWVNTMNDVKRISLIIAIIGIVMIYAISIFIEPESVTTGSIDLGDTGKYVIINGTITSMNVNDGHVFLDVDDGTGTIMVVMFERTARNYPEIYNVKKDDNVVIKGQVNVYKSEIEIIASSIWK